MMFLSTTCFGWMKTKVSESQKDLHGHKNYKSSSFNSALKYICSKNENFQHDQCSCFSLSNQHGIIVYTPKFTLIILSTCGQSIHNFMDSKMACALTTDLGMASSTPPRVNNDFCPTVPLLSVDFSPLPHSKE